VDVSIPASYSGDPGFESRSRDPLSWLKIVIVSLSLSLSTNPISIRLNRTLERSSKTSPLMFHDNFSASYGAVVYNLCSWNSVVEEVNNLKLRKINMAIDRGGICCIMINDEFLQLGGWMPVWLENVNLPWMSHFHVLRNINMATKRISAVFSNVTGDPLKLDQVNLKPMLNKRMLKRDYFMGCSDNYT